MASDICVIQEVRVCHGHFELGFNDAGYWWSNAEAVPDFVGPFPSEAEATIDAMSIFNPRGSDHVPVHPER